MSTKNRWERAHDWATYPQETAARWYNVVRTGYRLIHLERGEPHDGVRTAKGAGMGLMPAQGGPPAFGHLLRRYRQARGLTQAELAERAGLSARAISDLERGINRSPRRDTLEMLAEALSLTSSDTAALDAAARERGRSSFDLLRGRSPMTEARPASRAGLPLELVGRRRELELLAAHLEGQGPPLLLLAGEPGIGKSRLLREAAQGAVGYGLRVLESGCQRGGQRPYAPLPEALATYFDDQPSSQVREELRDCAWLAYLLPELASEFPDTLPGWSLPAEQERRLMFSATARFLTRIAGPSGTLLLLDDLQWAGQDALDLLQTLVRSPLEAPLRVVGAYRDSEVHPGDPLALLVGDLARDRLVAQQVLGALETPEARELLSQLLEFGVASADLVEEALRRAEGVPFFLVSFAQGLRTRVQGGNGGSEISGGAPWDVAETIRQRVAALPPATQELLRVTAVASRRIERGVLVTVAAASGWQEREAIDALDAACHARLLTEVGEDYQFTHDLIREVVGANISAARRAAFHRRIAEALESSRSSAPAELLAYHYARAGEGEKAIFYLERAGDNAAALYAHAAAEGYYSQLVQRLDDVGRSWAAAQAREKLGAALFAQAKYDATIDVLGPALEVYRSSDDIEGLARTAAQLGQAYADWGASTEGLAFLRSILEAVDERELQMASLARVYLAQARLFHRAGRNDEQLRAADRAIALARRASDNGLLAEAGHNRGLALLALGRPEEALAALEAVIGPADVTRDVWRLSHVLSSAGMVYRMLGKFYRAQEYFERSVTIARRIGEPAGASFVTFLYGELLFLMGEWERARAEYEAAAAIVRHVPFSWASLYPPMGLGLLYVVEGRIAEAERTLNPVLAQAEQTGNLYVQRWAQPQIAERDLLEERPEAALKRLLPLLDTPGQRETDVTLLLPFVAWAYQQLGDDEKATATFAESIQRAEEEHAIFGLVDILRIQAVLALHHARWAEAEHALGRALELSRNMPYPHAEARALYVYGLMHARKGEARQAHARLDAALVIFRRLGEQLYAPAAERLLATLTAPVRRPGARR